MPRPTRIQYEHAFYHVMNRGRGRQRIFHGEAYYQAFLKALEEAHQRFDAVIHAYCLMANHYHLLIETPRANLDRIMRHINGIYTQRYNRLKGTDGPLFRGRYKAILVDEDAYLLQVGRYIHRNPAEVRGAAPDVLAQYRWSSYPAYIGQAESPPWLARALTYQMLGRKQCYAGYRAYVEAGIDDELRHFYGKGNMAAILGDKGFRASLAEEKETLHVSGDLSRMLSDRPDAAAIVRAVAKVFGVREAAISERQQGRQSANLPRKVAIYCCQHWGNLSLKAIADHFGLAHPGSVSPAVADIKKRVASGELRRALREAAKELSVMK